ncbi:twin-arginine translocation signal domain-containing protein, partial [Vibrio fujianensis]
MSTSIIKKLFTRREFIQSSAAASGVAVAASSISLPFNALAAKSESSPSEEQIRYSACLVNCGSRCPFKVHVRDGVAVKISPEDGVNEAI